MASGPPVTDDERERVRNLHADGLNCREIADTIGRARSTVSTIARDLGLSFDRAQTRQATAARVADAKARRADLAALLLEDAHRLREQLWQPCDLVKIGGKDNVATREPLARPLFEDQLRIVQATGLAAERHARLVELDKDDGNSEVASLLGTLLGGLQAKHGTGDDEQQ